MIVIATREFNDSLVVGREYEVLGEKASSYKLRARGGTKWFPKSCFEVKEELVIVDTFFMENGSYTEPEGYSDKFVKVKVKKAEEQLEELQEVVEKVSDGVDKIVEAVEEMPTLEKTKIKRKHNKKSAE